MATRAVFGLVVAALLVTSIVGGLLRAGVAVPVPRDRAWPGQAVLAHAFLMISAFMGTVIAIERAVAVKARIAFAAPALSALAGLCMLSGAPAAAGWLAVAAALGFIAVGTVVWERQRAAHTVLLLAGATAWLIGNLLHAVGAQTAQVVPWWFSFLVLTIAGERLEMTRLMRRRRGAATTLYACLATMLAGAAMFTLAPARGGLVYGASLVALAVWLSVFDIARRTVMSHGLGRYMAVALLLGYCWLAISGAAWIAGTFGYAARDAALHALGLGFVFSMMLAHAPVILPALTRVKLLFGWHFYLPLALLHASLALRLLYGPLDFALLGDAAAGNAAAIALFAATLLGSALAWRFQHKPAQR
ncbi:MAG: hypothetical protein KGN16_19170 [Burkholderiales bacterium]|nr:hypothetical protein [Burkholderiales bacterium]